MKKILALLDDNTLWYSICSKDINKICLLTEFVQKVSVTSSFPSICAFLNFS